MSTIQSSSDKSAIDRETVSKRSDIQNPPQMLGKINYKHKGDKEPVITYINKKPKEIENPVSAMTLEDFRKYVDEMKKMKADNEIVPPAYGEDLRDKMIHNTLKACVDLKISEKKSRR